MAFLFDRDEDVADGVKRIAVEQLDAAARELSGAVPDRHEAVHQARKRFKKIRGLLRLARTGWAPERREVNARVRAMAQSLSEARDAEAVIEAFDALRATHADEWDAPGFDTVRAALVARRDRVAEAGGAADGTVEQVISDIHVLVAEVSAWPVNGTGFGALRDGLSRSYRRGRRALADAQALPSVERLHAWRKRVKDHWYHMRLLSGMWPAVMKARGAELKDLSEYLGDDHDLAVLKETLAGVDAVDRRVMDAIQTHAAQRRARLQEAAFALGARVYAEPPKAFSSRMGRYWRVWRSGPRV